MLCNFNESALRHSCPPKNLLQIFRTPFYKSTYDGRVTQHCNTAIKLYEELHISTKRLIIHCTKNEVFH